MFKHIHEEFDDCDDGDGVDIHIHVGRGHQRPRKRPPPIFIISMKDPVTGIIFTGAIMAAVQLSDVQGVDVSVVSEDAKGNPAPLAAAPAWVSNDPDVVAVTPAADGLSAHLAAGTKLGVAQVVITGNGVLADGTADPTAITGTIDVTTVSSEATQFAVNVGTPA